MVLAVAGLYFKGLNFGIEFEGGVEYTVSLPADQVTQDNVDKIRTAVADTGIDAAVVADREHLGRVHPGADRGADQRRGRPGDQRDRRGRRRRRQERHLRHRRSARAGVQQVAKRALTGLVVFLILVVLFIWAYFREWKMSVAAIVALIHDIVITIGVYALSGFEVTPATVTGLLTILGLLALRHRRRLRQGAGEHQEPAPEPAGPTPSWPTSRSTRRWCARSTPRSSPCCRSARSSTSASPRSAPGALKDLSLALFVGMAAGAYSSIFIATPLAVQLKSQREGDHPAGRPRQGACPARRRPLRRRAGRSPTTCRCATTDDGLDRPESSRRTDAAPGRRHRRVAPRPPAPAAWYPRPKKPLE